MILVIIVPCILCFVYAWRRRKKYLQGRLPPIGASAWPVVGHAHLWIRGPVSEPSDGAKIANECIAKFFLLDDSIKAMFGEGLTTLTVPVWEDRRTLLEPMFDQMSARLEVLNQHAKILAAELATKVRQGFFDQTEYLRDSTMGILLNKIYRSTEEKYLDAHKAILQEIAEVVYDRYRSFLKHKKLVFRWSNLKRRQDECVRTLKALTNEMISKNRVELNKDAEPMTLLDFFLQLELQKVNSEQNIVDEINGILFGGYSTTVNSMNFILVMIGSHTAIQERIYTEIQNIMGDSKRQVNMEDLNNFIYVHAVIIEVLRLYPAVTTIARKSHSSVDLKKYTVDPGTNCLLFIYAMNRHQSWGPDRDEFKPERWLDGTTQSPIATFGLGRRSCIGMKLALNTMKIILIHLLRDYRVIADHTKLEVKQELMLTPESGHYIALEKR